MTDNKISSKSALVTYVYPSAIKYLDDFMTAVKSQTISDFDVIFFNDGVNTLEHYDLPFHNVVIDISGSIAENRFQSFEILQKMNYENYIFLDVDDSMSNNRIEVLVKYLKSYSIVCNDLNLMTNEGSIAEHQIWYNRLQEGFLIDYKFIENKNVIGLGNVGFRKDILSFNLKKSLKPIAVDWFLFYQILREQDLECLFTSKCQTNYRQHDNNTAGIKHIDDTRIKYIIEIVKHHYSALVDIGYLEYRELLEQTTNLELQQNNFKSIKNPFWWEEIQLAYENN